MTEKGGPGICGKSAFCSIFLSVYNCSTNKIHFKKTMACCNDPLKTPGKKVYSITFQMSLLKLKY